MKTITRKEIAAAVGLSHETIRRNERIWGLNKCVVKAVRCPVTYDRDKANSALLEREIISMAI